MFVGVTPGTSAPCSFHAVSSSPLGLLLLQFVQNVKTRRPALGHCLARPHVVLGRPLQGGSRGRACRGCSRSREGSQLEHSQHPSSPARAVGPREGFSAGRARAWGGLGCSTGTPGHASAGSPRRRGAASRGWDRRCLDVCASSRTTGLSLRPDTVSLQVQVSCFDLWIAFIQQMAPGPHCPRHGAGLGRGRQEAGPSEHTRGPRRAARARACGGWRVQLCRRPVGTAMAQGQAP